MILCDKRDTVLEQEKNTMAAQPRLASTVMLLRDNDAGQGIEVFMVRRVVQSEFLPDIYVFPGGSVSADDHLAEETAGVCTPVALTAADPEGRTVLGSGTRAAAIREMFEEANVLLAYQDGTMLAINEDRKSTRLNSSHANISYAVFCLKKKK